MKFVHQVQQRSTQVVLYAVVQCAPLRQSVPCFSLKPQIKSACFFVNRTLILSIQCVVSTAFLNFFQTWALRTNIQIRLKKSVILTDPAISPRFNSNLLFYFRFLSLQRVAVVCIIGNPLSHATAFLNFTIKWWFFTQDYNDSVVKLLFLLKINKNPTHCLLNL